ncbi:hypothetical protein HY572_04790 [Candidatus Micrarchaeota archaeon]|nr:hypothetical protein [Candidatus Micrarchaeota archaeon]
MVFRIRFVALQLLLVFAVAQAAGLVVGSLFLAQDIQVMEDPSDPANALYFLGGILVSTAVLMAVLYFYKGTWFFKAVEALLMFVAANLFFSFFLDGVAALGVAVGLVALRLLFEPFRQYLLLFSTVVVGGLLGASLEFFPVLLFVVLLAAYDFAAVFLTKHMVFLAKRLDERKASFSVGFKQKRQEVQLGTGDFVVPIVLAVSVLNGFGPFLALAAGLGAVLGLGGLLWHMESRKGYFPGLPPIVGGQLLLVGVGFLVKTVLGG